MNVYVTFRLSIEAMLSLFLIQVLRTHVMVRVGGGWDTLEHYLDKHDPCRCAAFGEVTSHSPSSPLQNNFIVVPQCCMIHNIFKIIIKKHSHLMYYVQTRRRHC